MSIPSDPLVDDLDSERFLCCHVGIRRILQTYSFTGEERMCHMPHRPPSTPINDVINFFSRGPSRAEIVAFRLSPAALSYLQDLLQRNAAGSLMVEEQRELDHLVLLDDLLSLIRVRAQGDAPSAASA